MKKLKVDVEDIAIVMENHDKSMKQSLLPLKKGGGEGFKRVVQTAKSVRKRIA